MRQLEAIVYHVATSHIDQDLLLRIMTAFMAGTDYEEDLKIDIANAISKSDVKIKVED